MKKLKKCPFCGADVFPHKGINGLTFFYCLNDFCGAIVSFHGTDGKEEATNPIANWNRRETEVCKTFAS